MDDENSSGSLPKRSRSKKKQVGLSSWNDSDNLEDSDDTMDSSRSPTPKVVGGKSKARRQKRSPSPQQFMEEDVIDGFAICSFLSQDDLEVNY